jgi:hypothetical protein
LSSADSPGVAEQGTPIASTAMANNQLAFFIAVSFNALSKSEEGPQ